MINHKYFIAIIPSQPILSSIENLKKTISDNYQIKGALRSPAHITLHMPFTWPEANEKQLISRLELFKFHSKFMIHLKNFSCFQPRVVFIDVDANEPLRELQKKLVNHVKINLKLFNQAEDLRGFHPHITIAFRDLKKPVFYKLWEEFKDKTFNETFTCQSFFLLKHINQRWEPFKEFNFYSDVNP